MKAVTILVTKYKADDGEMFDTLSECMTYENEIELREHTKCLNLDFNSCNFDECDYLVIKDDEGVAAVEKYCLVHSFATPWKYNLSNRHPGYFKYDEESDSWVDIKKTMIEYDMMYASIVNATI